MFPLTIPAFSERRYYSCLSKLRQLYLHTNVLNYLYIIMTLLLITFQEVCYVQTSKIRSDVLLTVEVTLKTSQAFQDLQIEDCSS